MSGLQDRADTVFPAGEYTNFGTNYKRMIITRTVLGEPKAQMRHRHATRGKFTHTYDPSEAKKHTFAGILQMDAPDKPIDTPIKLELTFFMPRPKAHYGTGAKSECLKDSAPEWQSSKPDIDNLVKFVQDSLNGIYYKDDALIYQLIAIKVYSERPRTEIILTTLNT
jgi:Holliday junction resolvase RusA-like endonuclease